MKLFKQVLATFHGVRASHCNMCSELNERRFYNDSKATNILAAAKAAHLLFQSPLFYLREGLIVEMNLMSLKSAIKNVKAVITFGKQLKKLNE